MGKYQLDDQQKKLNQKFSGNAFQEKLTQREKIALLKEKTKKTKKKGNLKT